MFAAAFKEAALEMVKGVGEGIKEGVKEVGRNVSEELKEVFKNGVEEFSNKLMENLKPDSLIESLSLDDFSEALQEYKKALDEFEEVFNAKVQKIRTLVKGNRKYAYIKLKKEFPAIDIATKLGLM